MDSRSDRRVRTLLKARLIFDDGLRSVECLVRDLSEGGARLQVGSSAVLPDRFDLYMPKKHETRHARLKWRTSEEIGIAFDDVKSRAAPPSPAEDIAERLLRLETELAELRRLLTEKSDAGIAAAEPSDQERISATN